ncbi:hypothetical protein HN371_22960 [Candidatus Poribacteria bacterium]|nr:hypothetical protein [Candidatus Poribacteria bacterium]MBT5532995.1 hypothetical protein [Candidatus Poribacteria bacterium]MBT5709964.1 hypothetical protein [Candidatus Poribacteria bacterium]MBT7097144.1 hypothetical protein [Candidatus Poribacteria bacterium]MBT7805479.1 hypothetical protein [Candidatus Poribacteria bacterium]
MTFMRSAGALAIAAGIAISAPAATLFHDDFQAADLGDTWFLGHDGGGGAGPPEWVYGDGILSQTEPAPGDPTYAVIEGENWPESYGVVAKVRIDDWQDHDRSRAGVGMWLDMADDYGGYTWLIHERLTATNMEMLNDARAWFNQEESYEVVLGEWYWVKGFIDAESGDLMGKIWDADENEHDPATTDEPADWLVVRGFAEAGAERFPTMLAGLNGGAGTDGGHSTASFDDVFVFDADGPDPLAVEAAGKASTTWGALKSR